MATLTITSNGLPSPANFGKPFGSNAFSPRSNVVSAQTYNYSFTYRGGENTANPQVTVPLTPIGIMNNGVVFFNPSAGIGQVPPGLDPTSDAPGTGFEYNAVNFRSNYGGDDAGGWPETTGQYHYMSAMFLNLPTGSSESSSLGIQQWLPQMLHQHQHIILVQILVVIILDTQTDIVKF